MAKEHYATRYKKRIQQLEEAVRMYYMANYNAKKSIGGPGGTFVNMPVCMVATMEGNEEGPIINDVEGMRSIIDGLPLKDYGS